MRFPQTDDAELDDSLEQFGPADIDWEGEEYADWHSTPKCGGYSPEEFGGCNGCRHCSPADPEAEGTGYYVYDMPGFYAYRAEQLMLAEMGYARSRFESGFVELQNKVLGYNPKLARAIERKMWAIADESDGHGDFIAKFRPWRDAILARFSRIK